MIKRIKNVQLFKNVTEEMIEYYISNNQINMFRNLPSLQKGEMLNNKIVFRNIMIENCANTHPA